MPDSVEMPAPVKTTTCCAARRRSTSRVGSLIDANAKGWRSLVRKREIPRFGTGERARGSAGELPPAVARLVEALHHEQVDRAGDALGRQFAGGPCGHAQRRQIDA